MPDGGLSTGEVFSRYDEGVRAPFPGDMDGALRARREGDWRSLNGAACNALTGAAMEMSPSIARALEDVKALGAAMARMSGSGSAVFGVFEGEEALFRAERELKGRYPFCRAVSTAPRGVAWEEEA